MARCCLTVLDLEVVFRSFSGCLQLISTDSNTPYFGEHCGRQRLTKRKAFVQTRLLLRPAVKPSDVVSNPEYRIVIHRTVLESPAGEDPMR